MDTVTIILKYGQNKNCFLTVVEKRGNVNWHSLRSSRDEEIIVYEANLVRGLKAYFTVQGITVELSPGDTVQLNGWYANKLGIPDEEPLPLRRIKSSVAKAITVQVEPETADDWEILEKNAGRVEMVLLDQVRVVWKGHILPVWIQPSLLVSLKISEIEPAAPCVILEKNTTIIVTPKVRINAPPSSLNLPAQQAASSFEERWQQKQPSSWSLKQSNQYQSMTPPGRNQTEQLSNSSEFDNIDILEPRPSIVSPIKSPRTSLKRSSLDSRSNNFSSKMAPFASQPFVTRQSSFMDNIKKYIFSMMTDKKEALDNFSDSDRSSLMDYSIKDLPSRSGVLRVQPLHLSNTLEECFPVSKSELNKQILSKSGFNNRASVHISSFKIQDQKSCNIPLEVFQPSTIYIDAEFTKNERLLHPYLPPLPNNFIARLQRLPSPHDKALASQRGTKKSKTGTTAEPLPTESVENLDGLSTASSAGDFTSMSESCYVRVVTIDRKAGLTDRIWLKAAEEVLSHQPLLYGHVIISDLLRRQLRLEATGSVWIKTGTIDLVIPRKIHIYLLSKVPKNVTNDLIIMAFINYIRRCADEKHPLVVFQGIFLKFVIFPELQAEVQLTFFGDNDLGNAKAVTMLSELNIDSIQITVIQEPSEDKLGVVKSMLPYCQTSDFDMVPFPQKLKQLGGVDSLVQQALLYLHASLASRPLSRQSFQVRGGLSHGILLITGPKGSGKSSLVKGLCRKMAHLPVLAHVTLIDCKTLRGKTVSTIQKILELVFDEAAWREPAVIVLENLDVIVPAASGPETEITGEALYSAKNAQVLEGLIRYEIDNNSKVTVIATSTSRSSLHPSLVSSRGLHCIQQTLNIGSPDREAREKILLSILQKHSSVTLETVKTLDLTSIAMKTEGFVARDLELLVNRTLHIKMSNDRDAFDSKFTLTLEDFEETLSTFKPVSVRNVPLHKAGALGWMDVGGLEDVKRVLVETLRWPTKYPHLFSSCPLRLRSGILLYGAPGTGKTLLAGVVAKECGLNFISVKGPELLNKYIGASEQAIRDLFTKAQSAKPCALFFDEFDSIAPKRGHDSTGVTDRVVNQLLTQLDGVEGLQGVYVLAATSRPDLIDPALLRPGRLDICLHCAIPDENERHAILIALTHKMSLAPGVDLKEVALICEYFTGADLKALLYNAQLKAIHEQTDGDRSMNERIIWVEDQKNTQCGAKRRASVVVPDNATGPIKMSLDSIEKSASVSSLSDKTVLDDLQSPKLISSSEQQSPKQRGTSSNSTPRSSDNVRSSGIGEVDEVDFVYGNGKGDNRNKTHNLFQYPSPDHLDSGDEGKLSVKDTPEFHNFDGVKSSNDEIDNECFSFAEIDSGSLSASESYNKPSDVSLTVHPKTKLNDVPGNYSGIANIHHSKTSSSIKDFWDKQPDIGEEFGNLVNGEEIKIGNREIEPVSSNFKSVSSELVALAQSSFIPSQDEVDSVVADVSTGKAASSDTDNSQQQNRKSGSTSLPVIRRSRRSSQQGQARGNLPNLTVNKTASRQDPELRSPSIDRPVTVFTTLERGLAMLTEEDEARYIDMVKKIQHRDESLFEAANARRRTSLQLESKISGLLEVSQHHLLEAARSMRPSVSAAERDRYLRIYESFVSSRKYDFNKQQEVIAEKRATLA